MSRTEQIERIAKDRLIEILKNHYRIDESFVAEAILKEFEPRYCHNAQTTAVDYKEVENET